MDVTGGKQAFQFVIPAKAGIQNAPSAGEAHMARMDSRFRGNDAGKAI
jgi:hypothetical protein